MELIAIVYDLRGGELVVVGVCGIPDPKKFVSEKSCEEGRQHLHNTGKLRSAKVCIDDALHVVRI